MVNGTFGRIRIATFHGFTIIFSVESDKWNNYLVPRITKTFACSISVLCNPSEDILLLDNKTFYMGYACGIIYKICSNEGEDYVK